MLSPRRAAEQFPLAAVEVVLSPRSATAGPFPQPVEAAASPASLRRKAAAQGGSCPLLPEESQRPLLAARSVPLSAAEVAEAGLLVPSPAQPHPLLLLVRAAAREV